MEQGVVEENVAYPAIGSRSLRLRAIRGRVRAIVGHAGIVLAPRGRNPLPHLAAPLAVVALAIALALPAGAGAGTRSYKGDFTTGGVAKFEMRRNEQGVRKIVHWRWHNLPITCAQGERQHYGEFLKSRLPVTKGSFHGEGDYRDPEYPTRTGSAVVQGSFPKNWRAANGTFQVSGDTSRWDDCDTGVVQWTANRLPRTGTR